MMFLKAIRANESSFTPPVSFSHAPVQKTGTPEVKFDQMLRTQEQTIQQYTDLMKSEALSKVQESMDSYYKKNYLLEPKNLRDIDKVIIVGNLKRFAEKILAQLQPKSEVVPTVLIEQIKEMDIYKSFIVENAQNITGQTSQINNLPPVDLSSHRIQQSIIREAVTGYSSRHVIAQPAKPTQNKPAEKSKKNKSPLEEMSSEEYRRMNKMQENKNTSGESFSASA